MSAIEFTDIVNIIKSKYPKAEVKVYDCGKQGGIKKYSIEFQLNSSKITFNIGPNLVFSIAHLPRDVLKQLPLIHPDTAKDFVIKCLENLPKYLKKEKLPEIKDFARKYLGKEEKVEKKDQATYIFFDKFYVIVTPTAVHLLLKSNDNHIFFKEFKQKSDLEDIFKKLVFYADSINKGEFD